MSVRTARSPGPLYRPVRGGRCYGLSCREGLVAAMSGGAHCVSCRTPPARSMRPTSARGSHPSSTGVSGDAPSVGSVAMPSPPTTVPRRHPLGRSLWLSPDAATHRGAGPLRSAFAAAVPSEQPLIRVNDATRRLTRGRTRWRHTAAASAVDPETVSCVTSPGGGAPGRGAWRGMTLSGAPPSARVGRGRARRPNSPSRGTRERSAARQRTCAYVPDWASLPDAALVALLPVS
jgi:hypothetical protein